MTPEVTVLARSAADYAAGFANQLTIAITPGFTDAEQRAARVKAMMCLAQLGRDAAQLRKLMPEEDSEARARINDLRDNLRDVA